MTVPKIPILQYTGARPVMTPSLNAHSRFVRLLLWHLQFVHPVVQWIQKKRGGGGLDINGTFRYNTSDQRRSWGTRITIHTKCKTNEGDLKKINKTKPSCKYWTFIIYRRGSCSDGSLWEIGPVSRLYTCSGDLQRSKVYTQQCQTPLKATVIHLDNSRFFFPLLFFFFCCCW